MAKFGEETTIGDVIEAWEEHVGFEFSARFAYLNSPYVFRPATHCYPWFHRLHRT